MTESLYPKVPESDAVAALRLVEYGSCDGCGGHNMCVLCGADAHGYWDEARDEHIPEAELHEKTCAVGQALGRCKP